MTVSINVALYMSAWIEMNNQSTWSLVSNRRTLHECVDWNQILTETGQLNTGALYMSAWIEINAGQQVINDANVALYMSAWIEI